MAEEDARSITQLQARQSEEEIKEEAAPGETGPSESPSQLTFDYEGRDAGTIHKLKEEGLQFEEEDPSEVMMVVPPPPSSVLRSPPQEEASFQNQQSFVDESIRGTPMSKHGGCLISRSCTDFNNWFFCDRSYH